MYKEKEKEFHCVPWNEIPDKSAKQETQRSAMSKKKIVDVNVNILLGCN